MKRIGFILIAVSVITLAFGTTGCATVRSAATFAATDAAAELAPTTEAAP
jgi:predicted small secreted protein